MPSAQTKTPSSSTTTTTTTAAPAQNANKPNKTVDNKIAKAVAASEEQKSSNQDIAVNTGASSSSGNKTPQEQPEFIKQALIIIEKKSRNLDKRRIKLEEYRADQRKGIELNQDQLSAVNKYDEVLRTLELSRELEKQFVGLANDAMKQQKKQAKKEQLEREEAIRERIKETHKFLSLLDTFGDENVRNDFLNETNGAFKLTERELSILDEFNKLVQVSELGSKLDQSSSDAADHLLCLIESKNKPITSLTTEQPVTYSELRKIFDRILNSTYWTQEQEKSQAQEQEQQQDQQQTNENVPQTNDNSQEQQIQNDLVSSSSNLNDKQSNDEHQVVAPLDQGIYNQQNTSDDYVMVTSTDFSDNTQLKSQQNQHSPVNQQQQQQQQNQQQQPQQPHQTKTFFTTLNPNEMSSHRNINEFLNKCENSDDGINFLQDSEIQLRQQQQPQQQEQPQQQAQTQQDNYQQQPQQQQSQIPHHQTQNNGNYQEFNQNEGQKDNNGYKPRQGGNRDYNGGGRGGYQQRPRYQDRGGAPPQRNNGNASGSPSGYQNRNQNNNSNGGGYRGGRGGYSGGGRGGGYGGQGGMRGNGNAGPQQRNYNNSNNNYRNNNQQGQQQQHHQDYQSQQIIQN